MGRGSWMKEKNRHLREDWLQTTRNKGVGSRKAGGWNMRDLGISGGRAARKRESEDPPRTWLLRGTRQVPVKTEEQPASLLRTRGPGSVSAWSRAPKRDTLARAVLSKNGDPGHAKTVGAPAFPSPRLASPHTHRVCSKRHRSSCSYRPAQPH